MGTWTLMMIKYLACRVRGHQPVTTITDGEITEISLIPKEDHPSPWVRANSPGPMAYSLGVTNLTSRRECRHCGKRLG